MEKGSDLTPPYENGDNHVDIKQIRIGEATGIFGDADTADQYGYVSRG